MSDHHTYKKIEIVGSSRTSVDEAIQNGIAEASKTLRNVEWFEVGEIRGHVENGKIGHFQVTMKVGFSPPLPKALTATRQESQTRDGGRRFRKSRR